MAATSLAAAICRRGVLQVGAAGLLGLTLPRVLQAAARFTGKPHAPAADACILIFLSGGPSHLDMWDPKPDAPAEVRGEFKTIPTSVPGIRFGEHLPKLARLMHRVSLVRSVHHGTNQSHAAAVYTGLTGVELGDIILRDSPGPQDYPAIGSVLAMQRPPQAPVVPYVTMPYHPTEGKGGRPHKGYNAGYLGRARDPLFMLRDPDAPEFALPELSLGDDVSAGRVAQRRRLANRIERSSSLREDRAVTEAITHRTKAYELLTAPATSRAFRIEREPLALREAYGRNIYGQCTLLARRLIEAGTRVACITWGPHPNATWDTHKANFAKLKDECLPQLDAAVASLVQDLADRGMLDRTLVAVMGEFGRTPLVNDRAGRDHWNYCYSLLLAGGGIKGGYVHGSSDRIGARPRTDPLAPADVLATIYDRLGIPADLELHDRQNRPLLLLPGGKPVPALFA